MRTLLKIFVTGLLLMLVVALGTEVAALHRINLAAANQLAPPVVVRKSYSALMPPKRVRSVPGPAPVPPKLYKNASCLNPKALAPTR